MKILDNTDYGRLTPAVICTAAFHENELEIQFCPDDNQIVRIDLLNNEFNSAVLTPDNYPMLKSLAQEALRRTGWTESDVNLLHCDAKLTDFGIEILFPEKDIIIRTGGQFPKRTNAVDRAIDILILEIKTQLEEAASC